MNKILASSNDNFIVMESGAQGIVLPYVTFTIGSIPLSGVSITISDAFNENGYVETIEGGSTLETTKNTFNTSGMAIFSLYECLRMNSIFFNITFTAADTLKCFLDTSAKYNIISTDGIIIGGTYSSYSPSLPTKTVLMLQGKLEDMRNITMEKYHNNDTVSFNVTSPFQRMTFKKPLDFNIIGYQVIDGVATAATVPFNSITVMPTTLSKFQDGVDFNDYYYMDDGERKSFLTTQSERYYNYGEWVGLSILSDVDLELKKVYYTNSGVYIDTEWSTQYTERNGLRLDFYDTFGIESVEGINNKHVGYVLVTAWKLINGTRTDVTEPIRFEINPKCNGNNEIFFLNEIGGVDSFNFTASRAVSMSIDSQSAYYANHIRPYVDIYEDEYVSSKRNKVVTTLATNQLSRSLAEWLNQLVKSKYVYKFLGVVNPRYKMIVVDKFDVTTSSKLDEFEFELEYHNADNNEKI